MNNFGRRLYNFFSSRLFWRIILGFFIFEALWFVFSAVYPMAFDEDFHFGLIKLYSHYWTPFLSQQPPHADQFGAVYRDPSYLYHYLMSFPYRFIALFVHSETLQVISLRLMNVAMFTGALVLYRKLMLRMRASFALTHVALAIFILIPIVPQLAAHINYDNLFILLLPVLCLSAFSLLDSFKQRQVNILALFVFVVLSMLMTLVKYAGLPIILAAVLFLAVYSIVSFDGRFGRLWQAIVAGFGAANRRLLGVLIAGFLISSVLFAQRYGVNLVRYHNPVPDCGAVMTVQQCEAYSPWARDYAYTQTKKADFKPSTYTFVTSWFWGMWHRLFFAINGPSTDYVNYAQLPLPGIAAILLAVSLLTVFWWWRKVFQHDRYTTFGITIAVGYILVLFMNGYSDYVRVGQPVAINGRYLLPVLPLIAVALGRGIKLTLVRFKIERFKPYLAAVAVLFLLHGGGVFTFILRSDSTWYWPNPTVNKVNHDAQKVLKKVTIGSNHK
jgi:hypothetical protein